MFKHIKDIFKVTTNGLYCFVRIIVSVCLLTGIFYYSYSYLSKIFYNDEVYDGAGFHAMPEDGVDIIVLGSSHAQYSYVPAYMYQKTGLYSYVLGSACQPYEVSYEMLKEALKTQSPELVIMEAFTATPLSSTCAGDSCFVTAAYQMTGEEKYNVINMLPKEKAKTYYNDFINNHNRWKDIESLEELKPKEKEGIPSNFGYVDNYFLGADNYWYPTYYTDSNIQVELDTIDIESLNKIKTLCDSRNIQFMLYMVPMDSISEEDQAYRYKIWQWANENGILYQDYVDMAENIDYRMNVHSDGSHSYLNGASLITNKLASFIKDNYSFNSHIDNKVLEKKNRKFITDYSYLMYSTEENPSIYLDEINGYKGTYIFRYIPGQTMTNELVEKIKELGLTSFDSNNTYYAIVNDGEILSEGNDYAQTTIDGQELFVDYYQILQNNNIIPYEGVLNIVIFNTDYSLFITKNIQKVKPDWWNANKDYWEYGYNMYYAKNE